jgi:RNA polymerase sigma-70 factor, ECF subfamily
LNATIDVQRWSTMGTAHLRSRRRRSTPVAELSDEALMAIVAAGEHAGLDELSVRYRPRVEQLGVKLLGERGLAEELTQETFTRLWRRASAYDRERGTVPTFVFAIARRVAVDLWRRPSSRPVDDPAVADPASAPSDEIAPLLTGLTVRRALSTLSTMHREVIELAYFRDLSQSQIAERLQLPLGTVKTRTFHALRSLKTALADLDPASPSVGW